MVYCLMDIIYEDVQNESKGKRVSNSNLHSKGQMKKPKAVILFDVFVSGANIRQKERLALHENVKSFSM